MTRSLFRKADGPSRSDYRKTVALKLAAFIIALAVFLPLTALLSRPKSMKDLSGGVLPFTFATKDKELQKELAGLNAARALPNQRAEAKAAGSKRLCEAVADALSSPEFQRMKTSCDQFQANLEGYVDEEGSSAQGAPSVQDIVDFVRQSQGQFDSAFELRYPQQQELLQALSTGEASAAPVSLKEMEQESGPSQLPDLQRALDLRYAVQVANGDGAAALKTLELAFKLANCSLNSTEPDIFYLLDTLQNVAKLLPAKSWTNDSLRDLQAMLQKQRSRPFPQRQLLAFERERALFVFEHVRQTGIRSINGAAPGMNMVADSIRELKPGVTVDAAKAMWQGFSYDPDADELAALKMFSRLSGPGFMPFFKAAELLKKQPEDGPIAAKTRANLLSSLQRQSETVSLMEAMDAALRLRLNAEIDKSKLSPLNGKPYRLLKPQGRYKVVYGDGDDDAVFIEPGPQQ